MKANQALCHARAAALSAAVAVLLAASGQASATAVVAATEPTQILNHVELLAQYEKQVQQALTQTQMYVSLAKQLQNMPEQARATFQAAHSEFSNINLNDLESAQQLVGALQSAQTNVGVLAGQDQHAYDTITALQAKGIQISPAQYELGMSELAQQHADTYGVQLANYQSALVGQQAAMKQMNAIAASAPSLVSEVGGLQGVVSSNAVLGQQLVGINNSLIQANIMTAKRNQDALNADAAQRDDTQCSNDVLANMLMGPSTADATTSCNKAYQLHQQALSAQSAGG